MPCNSAAVVARPDLIEDEVKANSRLTYMAASQKSFGIPTWQYRRETNYQRHYYGRQQPSQVGGLLPLRHSREQHASALRSS